MNTRLIFLGFLSVIIAFYLKLKADGFGFSDGYLTELECAQLVTKQGLTAGVKDMIDGFEDWSSKVERVKMKVTLLQGRFDPNVPIRSSKAFARHIFNDHLGSRGVIN